MCSSYVRASSRAFQMSSLNQVFWREKTQKHVYIYFPKMLPFFHSPQNPTSFVTTKGGVGLPRNKICRHPRNLVIPSRQCVPAIRYWTFLVDQASIVVRPCRWSSLTGHARLHTTRDVDGGTCLVTRQTTKSRKKKKYTHEMYRRWQWRSQSLSTCPGSGFSEEWERMDMTIKRRERHNSAKTRANNASISQDPPTCFGGVDIPGPATCFDGRRHSWGRVTRLHLWASSTTRHGPKAQGC